MYNKKDIKMKVDTNIKLNNTEQELFFIIKKVIETNNLSTKAYVAGGWTRDHLLGIPSNDIDIMIDNMSGERFAKLVTQYLNIKDPHVIKENPEASKNITTAKAYIPLSSGTQEVDFAQARSEVYSENSRIPEIKNATPQEDAFRRDLTINSIFYDIINNKVVDFTGKGIQDLITNTIRTPEDPLKTFRDDPLRIFRVVRFSAKLNGNIDPDTLQAMSDPSLRQDIQQKVSKERISDEFYKMLKGNNPEKAISLLKQTGLLDDIIKEAIKGTKYEGKLKDFEMEQMNPHHELSLWGHTLETVTNTAKNFANDNDDKRALAILAALFHDIGKMYSEVHRPKLEKGKPATYIDPITNETKPITTYHNHEDESAILTPLVMQYLKFSNDKIEQVNNLVSAHMQLHDYARSKHDDSQFRKLIRELTENSIHYTDLFKLTLADAYAKSKNVDQDTIKKYEELNNKLKQVSSTMGDLQQFTKPILNGYEIMNLFKDNSGKPKQAGTWLGEVINTAKTLRDNNPNITKQEASEILKKRFPQYLPKPILDGNDIIQIFNRPAGAWLQEVKKFVSTLDPNMPKQEAINLVQNQFNKTSSVASFDSKNIPDKKCSKHLFDQKKLELKLEWANKNYYKILTNIKNFMSEYGNDEEVVLLCAQYTFLLLTISEKFKDRDLLQYIFSTSESEVYDTDLGCFVFGILITIKTDTKDEAIIEIGERCRKLSPKLMKAVVKIALESNVYKQKIKKDFHHKLENNNK